MIDIRQDIKREIEDELMVGIFTAFPIIYFILSVNYYEYYKQLKDPNSEESKSFGAVISRTRMNTVSKTITIFTTCLAVIRTYCMIFILVFINAYPWI